MTKLWSPWRTRWIRSSWQSSSWLRPRTRGVDGSERAPQAVAVTTSCRRATDASLLWLQDEIRALG